MLYRFWIRIKCFLVYSGLLQSACNVLWNVDNQVSSQLCSHLLGLWQFFKCCHMFLCRFLLADQERSDHQSWVFTLWIYLWKKVLCVLLWPHYLWTMKQKVCCSLKTRLNQIIQILVLCMRWYFQLIFVPSVCWFESWF